MKKNANWLLGVSLGTCIAMISGAWSFAPTLNTRSHAGNAQRAASHKTLNVDSVRG